MPIWRPPTDLAIWCATGLAPNVHQCKRLDELLTAAAWVNAMNVAKYLGARQLATPDHARLRARRRSAHLASIGLRKHSNADAIGPSQRHCERQERVRASANPTRESELLSRERECRLRASLERLRSMGTPRPAPCYSKRSFSGALRSAKWFSRGRRLLDILWIVRRDSAYFVPVP